MPKSTDLLKLEISLGQLQKNAPDAEKNDEEEGGGESSGSVGGQGGIVVEKLMFVDLFSSLRIGEKPFGIANDFDVSGYLNKNNPQFQNELGHDSGLKAHPILSQLAKFDGDTPNMRMDPKENPEAQQRYENRLQLRMALQNRQQHQATPKPKPGGM